ncbi:MAG: hypothetical protein IPK17_28600 [Chloroflexi bacterium]|uniref:hypothetical protein n=1 Tax=Candidatus Flexifilum breve TaxID=3140694 RepID=UPI003136EE9C|nr:hypothetical protein [Chloroflexota bacterium]
MRHVQQLLRDLGLPEGDRHDLPTSPHRFPDGAQYRVEIPSVEGPAALQAVLDTARSFGLTIHRVSQGSGIMLLTDADIREMGRLGREAGIEVCLFVGPRAPWEGSAIPLTPDGKIFGWRHLGMDQLTYGYNDVERACDLGIRSVLPADEGLIWLVNQGRERGLLPKNLIMKGSALMGVANPIGIKMLEDAGLNTINVASDISLARLAALRQVLSIPIDLYIEGPDGLGGFTRYHELAEIVRVGAPIYLKFGLRNAPNIYPSGIHLENAAISTGKERVRRAFIGMEHLARSGAQFSTSNTGAADLGIPE